MPTSENGLKTHENRPFFTGDFTREVSFFTFQSRLCKMFGWTNPKMAMVYFNPSVSDIAKRLDNHN